jgi:hypothetical protein
MGCRWCSSGLGLNCQGPLGFDDLEVACDCARARVTHALSAIVRTARTWEGRSPVTSLMTTCIWRTIHDEHFYWNACTTEDSLFFS